MTYTPRPGSVADRALSHLRAQPFGAELSTSKLAEALGVQSFGLASAMQPALDAGMLLARQKGGHQRSPMFWSLKIDHAAAATHKVPDELVQPQRNGNSRRAATTSPTGAEEAFRAERCRSAAGGQPAAAGPAGGSLRVPLQPGQAVRAPTQQQHLIGSTATISMSGEVAIVAECGTVILFDAQRGRQLVGWLAGRVG